MKTLTTIITAILAITLSTANTMTPPAESFARFQMKEVIDNQLNYSAAVQELNTEGTVELTVEVTRDNQLHVTYIDGDAELSEYVQANIDNLKIENPLIPGDSFEFELKFEK